MAKLVVEGSMERLGNDERMLIARAESALAPIVLSVEEKVNYRYTFRRQVFAVIVTAPPPVRIQFRARVPERSSNGIIWRQLPLSTDLFDGEAFNARYLEELKAAFNEYIVQQKKRTARILMLRGQPREKKKGKKENLR